MRITGVFEVVAEIEEIGARVGDMLVVGEDQPHPVCLVRNLGTHDARWAFRPECARLVLTRPPCRPSDLRRYRRHWLRRTRPTHLRLLE